jgi:hypothetical protein
MEGIKTGNPEEQRVWKEAAAMARLSSERSYLPEWAKLQTFEGMDSRACPWSCLPLQPLMKEGTG